MKAYAGIGSRETPLEVADTMYSVAAFLRCEGYILRSGGAPGADTAFERGCARKDMMEIFLPWNYFNDHGKQEVPITEKAMEIAAQYHPGWKHLKQGPRKLMARNVYQILGANLNPEEKVKFVLCWTPDGCESGTTRTRATGGTGQAISIATAYDVPVINMFNKDWESRLKEIGW